MANTLKPLDRKQLKFIDLYVHKQDVGLAAIGAGYERAKGKLLFANKRIRSEIDRKIAIVDAEKAKLIAKEQVLTKDFLDKNLVKVIDVDIEKIPQLGPTKLNAIEMGYKNIGVIIGGEFLPPPPDPNAPKPIERPRIFRAQEQSILRVETTEHVVTRTVEADPWA